MKLWSFEVFNIFYDVLLFYVNVFTRVRTESFAKINVAGRWTHMSETFYTVNNIKVCSKLLHEYMNLHTIFVRRRRLNLIII